MTRLNKSRGSERKSDMVKALVNSIQSQFEKKTLHTTQFPAACHYCQKAMPKHKVNFTFRKADPWLTLKEKIMEIPKRRVVNLTARSLPKKLKEIWQLEPFDLVCNRCMRKAHNEQAYQIGLNDAITDAFRLKKIKFLFSKALGEYPDRYLELITQSIEKSRGKPEVLSTPQLVKLWSFIPRITRYLNEADSLQNFIDRWYIHVSNGLGTEDPNILVYIGQTLGLLLEHAHVDRYLGFMAKLSDDMRYQVFYHIVIHFQTKPLSPEFIALLNKCPLAGESGYKVGEIFLNTIFFRGTRFLISSLFIVYNDLPAAYRGLCLENISHIPKIKVLESIIEGLSGEGGRPDEKYTELLTPLNNQMAQLRTIAEELERNTDREVAELKILAKNFKRRKDELLSLEFEKKYELRLTQQYRRAIAPHMDLNTQLFQEFFKKTPITLVAFDIEEKRAKPVCVLGISLSPDLKYRVKNIIIKNIVDINDHSLAVFRRYRSWLQNSDGDLVISHGLNWREQQLATTSGLKIANTYEVLQDLRKEKYIYLKSLHGEGLRHFEDLFGFERIACGLFKHKLPDKSYFHAMDHSFENHLDNKPQRICQICGKPQDVLLYCLEDALVSMLIYVWDKTKNK